VWQVRQPKWLNNAKNDVFWSGFFAGCEHCRGPRNSCVKILQFCSGLFAGGERFCGSRNAGWRQGHFGSGLFAAREIFSQLARSEAHGSFSLFAIKRDLELIPKVPNFWGGYTLLSSVLFPDQDFEKKLVWRLMMMNSLEDLCLGIIIMLG
jgi:hypothetical protein